MLICGQTSTNSPKLYYFCFSYALELLVLSLVPLIWLFFVFVYVKGLESP